MIRTFARIAMTCVFAVVAAGLCSCSETTSPFARKEGKAKMSISKQPFGQVDGKQAYLYTLTNIHGLKAGITNYGGIVVSLYVPDRHGKFDDVVLGYDHLDGYLKATPYFGAIVGRYGNRIAKGRFTLDGVEYKLAANNNGNALHGGLKGFDKVVWDAEPFMNDNEVGIKITYLSRDGEEGYPGNLTATVWYSLTNADELRLRYDATTDKATPLNLTHHGYWNLAGQGKRDILDHQLMLNADRFTPVDAGLITTGELRPVKGTPMDFTSPTAIGARINQTDDAQIKYGLGYDHNWVLNRTDSTSMSLAARVYEPTTGRIMEVVTTEPGIQFYAGNFLDGSITGKAGRVYKHRYGFCLETQHYPDSPNKPNFPSVILRPGEHYKHETIYRFSSK